MHWCVRSFSAPYISESFTSRGVALCLIFNHVGSKACFNNKQGQSNKTLLAAAGQNKSVSKMPTSLSLLLLSAILVLSYSVPKYYLVETEDGLEGIYIYRKNPENFHPGEPGEDGDDHGIMCPPTSVGDPPGTGHPPPSLPRLWKPRHCKKFGDYPYCKCLKSNCKPGGKDYPCQVIVVF